MDFGKLLSVAKRNTSGGGQNGEGRYYSTKFAPPKKENKEKKLSDNIKKFLAKQAEEERAKTLEARRKADELMSNRDVKAKKKIEKMLKVIKSANKSVLDDAMDSQITAIALAGPDQPDEDDYGYTSNVASQFYQQLMDKYKSNPEEQKFKEAERRTMSKEDIAKTRARVKDAIMRQVEEENGPRTRKARNAVGTGDERESGGKILRGPDPYDPAEEQRRREAEAARLKGEEKKRSPRKGSGAPPPPDFATLLKLAEQKQKEPIRIEVAPVVEKRRAEPERLMTKREKKEHDERTAFFEMKRLRDRIKDDPNLSEKEKHQRLVKLEAMRAAGKLPGIPASGGDSGPRQSAPPTASSPKVAPTANGITPNAKPSASASTVASRSAAIDSRPRPSVAKQTEQQQMGKIPKRSDVRSDQPAGSKKAAIGDNQGPTAAAARSLPSTESSHSSKGKPKPSASTKLSTNVGPNHRQPLPASSAGTIHKSSQKSTTKEPSVNGQVPRSKVPPPSGNTSKSSSSSSTATTNAKSGAHTAPSGPAARPSSASSASVSATKADSMRPAKNVPRQAGPVRPSVSIGPPGQRRRAPPETGSSQTRQFPPADMQRSAKRPMMRQNGQQKPPPGSSAGKKRRVIDSDSEYDSEMDDFIDDGDCEEDYSSAIKEIFGYDKSRYRDEYYDDDEDYNMESTYAQQMREEYISKKIGIMEDLEDMRMEEEEKQRKTGKKLPATTKKNPATDSPLPETELGPLRTASQHRTTAWANDLERFKTTADESTVELEIFD